MLTKIKLAMNVAKMFIRANAPTIMFFGGLAAAGVAAIELVRASVEAKPLLEKHTENFERIKDGMQHPEKYDNADPENLKALKRKEILDTGKDFGRLYFKAIIWGGVSLALLIGGHCLLAKKSAENAALAAATAASLNVVEGNIRKVFGDSGVRAFHDEEFDPSMFVVTDKTTPEEREAMKQRFSEKYDGGVKKTDDGLVIDIPEIRKFIYTKDKVYHEWWYADPIERIKNLAMIQNTCNRMLNNGSRKGMTFNEVLAEIGVREDCRPAYGQIDGWLAGDIIDFGIGEVVDMIRICEMDKQCNDRLYRTIQANLDGTELRFNTTGPVADRIFAGAVS